jgi:glycine/D-amino acid oxidase-like deaminating enzyme
VNRADVVVAGAGIAGIATTWQLMEQGVTSVVLVDPRPPLTVTSNKTGANYRDWWPSAPMVALTRRSIELMRTLVKSGAPFTMNRRGYLYLSTRPDFAGSAERLLEPYRRVDLGPMRLHRHSRAADYQLPARNGLAGPDGADLLLHPDFIRQIFPHFSSDVTGAIHARNAGTIDTVALGEYLLDLARRRGALLVSGEVSGIEMDGGRVSAVSITQGRQHDRIATRHFVNAAGPFVSHVAARMQVPLPVTNVLQQKVAFADPQGAIPPESPFTICLDPSGSLPAGLHLKPDSLDGRPVIKLGCAFNQDPEEPRWDPAGSSDFAARVLGAAAELVPGMGKYAGQAPVAHDAGYYTRTPDDLPLIGPLGPDGGFVVGGFAGYGAMVACAAGEIAASWITGREPPPWATLFTPDRFARSGYTPPPSGARSGAL